MALLEIHDLSKSFGGVQAVNKCSFSVEEGTITGLIGPNGAGKTTLFNLATGFYKPDTGQVKFQDKDITAVAPHRVFHSGICRTFQITREFKEMTVLENLMLVPSGQLGERVFAPWFLNRKVRKQEQEVYEKALQVIEYVNLKHLTNEYAGNLSGGQRKLVEIARAMMSDPKMILLDEPGAGVNPTLMKKLIGYIRELRDERGITFLLIEHDMEMIMNLCEPIIVMSEGTKLMQGNAHEVRNDKRVLDAYLGGQHADS